MTVRRRTALQAAAWAAPVLVVAASTPSAAASPVLAPHIDTVDPASVPSSADTLITVTGERFVPFATDVSVMLISVTYTPSVTVISEHELTFMMPATHATGEADLLVTTAAGTGYGLLLFV